MRKLRSSVGESIGEVLVAMLIVALGSVMFVTMVSASQKLITTSQKAYNQYSESKKQLESESISPINGAAVKIESNTESEGTTSSDSTTESVPQSICNIDSQAKENVELFVSGDKFIYEPQKTAEGGS